MCMKASLESNREAQGASPADEGSKLLSIIVPVYNIAPYLDTCVESLVNQHYANVEILLIDDGSTDGSGTICDDWAAKDGRVKVFHKENGGQASAKNLGIDHCTGELVTFVDGDDWVDPEMYSTMIGPMEQNGGTIAACAFNYVFETGCVHTGRNSGALSVYPRSQALLMMALQQELMFESTLKVFCREVIGEARFPEGKLYEEVAFARQVTPRMGNVVYIDRPFYQYRQNRPGNTNSSFPPSKLDMIAECDLFVQELEDAGLLEAAAGMEAFTLEHLMRMYANAKDCNAPNWMIQRIKQEYRSRYKNALTNPYVRKFRGLLFALAPAAYRVASKRVQQYKQTQQTP